MQVNKPPLLFVFPLDFGLKRKFPIQSISDELNRGRYLRRLQHHVPGKAQPNVSRPHLSNVYPVVSKPKNLKL